MRNLIFISIILFKLNALSEDLTLESAISIALKFNPEIQKISTKIQGVKGIRMQLEAYPNPELTFSREGLGSERETSLGIIQTFEPPQIRKLKKEIGILKERTALEELRRAEKLIISKVKKVYFKAVFTKEKIEILEKIRENIENYIEDANLKYRAGKVPFTDVLRGRIELLKLKNEIIDAKREFNMDISNLKIALGVKLEGEVSLLTPLRFIPFEKTLGELLEGIESIPSIEFEKSNLQIARKELELTKNAFYPDLKLGFFYPSIRKNSWGFELGISLPVFQKGLRGGILEANSNKIVAEISLESKRSLLREKFETLFLSLKNSEELLKNYENYIFPELEDLFNSSLSNYQGGLLSSLELFDVIRTFRNTKIEYKKELLNYNYILAEIESAGEED